MNAPTQGPWTAERTYLTISDNPSMRVTAMGGKRIVCDVIWSEEPSHTCFTHDVEEMRANARLIAEAPIMLALLRRARQQLPLAAACWHEEPQYAANVESVLALISEIQAAIANVTGEH